MTTTERILALMECNDVKASTLTKELSLSHGVVTQWKQGLQKPSTDAIIKLADYFGVSTDYLLGRTDKKDPMYIPGIKKEPTVRLIKSEGVDIMNKSDLIKLAENIERKLGEIERKRQDPNHRSLLARVKEAKKLLEIGNEDELLQLPVKEFLHYIEDAVLEEEVSEAKSYIEGRLLELLGEFDREPDQLRLLGYVIDVVGKMKNKIGTSTLKSWIKKYDETGEIKNKPLARKHKKICPDELRAYVAEHPDAFLSEIAEKFKCWPSAVDKALKKLGITRKKDEALQRARSRKSEGISASNRRYSRRIHRLCGRNGY